MTPSARRFDLALPPLTLACGVPLRTLTLAGWWWGPADDLARLDAAVDHRPDDPATSSQVAPVRPGTPAKAPALTAEVPTIVCVHALTGDARLGGEGGWWSPVVGPGRPLDPDHARLLCFNQLGSCYGSTGPTDPDFPTLADVPGERPAPDKGAFAVPEHALPAPLTTWDQARAILAALDALGIQRVDLLVGGSVGGMVALALAALAPERFPHLGIVAALDRATPWIVGWNHIGRQAIVEALRHGIAPDRAFALARQIAHMTYRAGPGLMARHGRRVVGTTGWSATAPYAVQTYLEHQGQKLVDRFDARAYVSQLDAMDHHDLSRPPPAPDAHETWTLPATWTGLARIAGQLDALAIDSDELFFADEVHDLVVRHRAHGHRGSWTLLRSPHGHDAFLLAWPQVEAFLNGLTAPLRPGGPRG